MANEKIFKTIIIGSGISGLSCAKNLSTKNADFLVITKDIDGRIEECKGKDINYGAYYVMSFYRHFLQFAKKTERLTIFKIRFFDNQLNGYTVFSTKLILCFWQLFRFIFILLKFKLKYKKFRKNCENIEQKEAITVDKYLQKIYQQNALAFIKENHLEKLADTYISQMFWGQTFSTLDKVNAFTFLEFSLPLITPTYKFIFLNEKITSDFKDKITLSEIEKIAKKNNIFKLEDNKGNYFLGKNLVLATPINVSKKLLENIVEIKDIKNPVSVHVYQLRGKIKENFNKNEINVFSTNVNVFSIATQSDGTFLLYAPNEYTEFERFFVQYDVINYTFWDPAFNIDGNTLLECNIAENIYLASDHNICGLEDSYIQGIYISTLLNK